MRSLVSACIHHNHLECSWYVFSLSTVLIWWRSRTVRALKLSYEATLMRKLLDNQPLPLSLSMNTGSVVLNSSISIVAILYFDIGPISSTFSLFDWWVLARQVWWFVPIPLREREGGGGEGVFLKTFWVIFTDDSLKASHVSTSMELMWGGVNLRVSWFLIQFILALPSKFLSFMFRPF